MGNDLYWKITPKKKKEKLHLISYGTWHHLPLIWNKIKDDEYFVKEPDDLSGLKLTKKELPGLRKRYQNAFNLGNKTLAEDLDELIKAIEKYDSITLVISG